MILEVCQPLAQRCHSHRKSTIWGIKFVAKWRYEEKEAARLKETTPDASNEVSCFPTAFLNGETLDTYCNMSLKSLKTMATSCCQSLPLCSDDDMGNREVVIPSWSLEGSPYTIYSY